VAWTGNTDSLIRANLHTRTATRVLVRFAEFNARTFFELERHARRLPWSRFLAPHRDVALRVTCHKSRLYHQGAVAQRFLEAIEHTTGSRGKVAAADDAHGTAQLFVVRFVRDHCTVSIDASGDPLYRRGYRQALAKAPLRETLAAAMILASRWDLRSPLVDPLCGSGTIAIEAALLARKIPPGLARASREPRDFAFLHWPGFDHSAWRTALDNAHAHILPASPASILAADRNAGAIRAARANADRASVLHDIDFAVRSLDALQPPVPAWIITNPPYGRRAGQPDEIRGVLQRLRHLAATPALTVAALLPEDWPPLAAATPAFHTRNGGLPVRLDIGTQSLPSTPTDGLPIPIP
jgi:putative N6-adenine-specific DNA methylase